jgi:parallel beta-helix repeat protein
MLHKRHPGVHALFVAVCGLSLVLMNDRGASAGIQLVPPLGEGGNVVVLPPGADGLAGAIAAAGRGGTVLVKSGLHTESGTVLVLSPVRIVGEAGAILESQTVASTTQPTVIEPALHIRGASGTVVRGLEFRPPADTEGNYAIVIEDSGSVAIRRNLIHGYEGGVMLQNANNATIAGNTIQVNPAFADMGIVVINGRGARIDGNAVSGGLFNIWACDRGGEASGNLLTGGLVGLILCKVPAGAYVVSGVPRGSDGPGQGWSVRGNNATGNTWGYLAIDDGNNSTFADNQASGNFLYDMELAGDSMRFGFLTPSSFLNTVKQKGMLVKDCGRDNRVIQGTLIDTTADPCF